MNNKELLAKAISKLSKEEAMKEYIKIFEQLNPNWMNVKPKL